MYRQGIRNGSCKEQQMGKPLTTAKVLATLIELSKERGLPQLFEIEYYKNARVSTIPITCLEHKADEIRT